MANSLETSLLRQTLPNLVWEDSDSLTSFYFNNLDLADQLLAGYPDQDLEKEITTLSDVKASEEPVISPTLALILLDLVRSKGKDKKSKLDQITIIRQRFAMLHFSNEAKKLRLELDDLEKSSQRMTPEEARQQNGVAKEKYQELDNLEKRDYETNYAVVSWLIHVDGIPAINIEEYLTNAAKFTGPEIIVIKGIVAQVKKHTEKIVKKFNTLKFGPDATTYQNYNRVVISQLVNDDGIPAGAIISFATGKRNSAEISDDELNFVTQAANGAVRTITTHPHGT